jgi:hypothetical protein
MASQPMASTGTNPIAGVGADNQPQLAKPVGRVGGDICGWGQRGEPDRARATRRKRGSYRPVAA